MGTFTTELPAAAIPPATNATPVLGSSVYRAKVFDATPYTAKYAPIAIPAPHAAPATPWYKLDRPRDADCNAMVGRKLAGSRGFKVATMGFTEGFLAPNRVCKRTLMVSRGWMVDWEAARATAPATTSDTGFEATLGGAGGAVGAAAATSIASVMEAEVPERWLERRDVGKAFRLSRMAFGMFGYTGFSVNGRLR